MNTSTRTPVNIIKDQRGQAMVEFTFGIIILIIILLATATVVFWYDDDTTIKKISRDGAREITITGDEGQARNRAEQIAWLYGLDDDKLKIDFNNISFGARNLVSCKVNYTSSPFSRLFPTLVGEAPIDDIELESEAIFGWWDRGN